MQRYELKPSSSRRLEKLVKPGKEGCCSSSRERHCSSARLVDFWGRPLPSLLNGMVGLARGVSRTIERRCYNAGGPGLVKGESGTAQIPCSSGRFRGGRRIPATLWRTRRQRRLLGTGRDRCSPRYLRRPQSGRWRPLACDCWQPYRCACTCKSAPAEQEARHRSRELKLSPRRKDP